MASHDEELRLARERLKLGLDQKLIMENLFDARRNFSKNLKPILADTEVYARSLYHLGFLEHLDGHLVAARDYFERAVAHERLPRSQHIKALYRLAILHLQTEKRRAAQQLMETAREMDSERQFQTEYEYVSTVISAHAQSAPFLKVCYRHERMSSEMFEVQDVDSVFEELEEESEYYLLDCRRSDNMFYLLTHQGDVRLHYWQGILLLAICKHGSMTRDEVVDKLADFDIRPERVRSKIDEFRRTLEDCDLPRETLVFDRSQQTYVWRAGMLVALIRSDQRAL